VYPRRLLVSLTIGIGALALVPVASAAISPTVSLTQGATKAGSTVPFGMDLKFAPTGGDSPRNVTLSLPPGLLSDASVDGGKCLHNTQATNACKVGGGTATAAVSGIPASLPLSFYLVAPPKHGDLAGLVTKVQLPTGSQQLGSPGDILIRSGSDPRGVGVNIVLSNLPNSFSGIPLSLRELNSTFDGLRLPTSCPATPATVQITANSYNDATSHSAQAPLRVTGCSSIPFNAAFHVTAVKDKSDHGVKVVTELTQPAKPAQATAGTVRLTLPDALTPNLREALTGGILCTKSSTATCTPVGSASTTSPLYPTPLIGKVYLTAKTASNGLPGSPAITIVFPPPFSLTIIGAVNLGGTTTFHNVPDIPQTDLRVTLFGGKKAVFDTVCSPSSGTASARLTSQDGNRSTLAPSKFAIAGCVAPKRERPRLSSAAVSGLAKGLPKLSFGLVAGKGAPELAAFTVKLPNGLRFAKHHGKLSGVSISGGKAQSLSLKQGHLVVSLASESKSLRVRIKPSALSERPSLKTKAKHHSTPSLKLVVVAKDALGTRTTISRSLKAS
jgi:hypothetical protein